MKIIKLVSVKVLLSGIFLLGSLSSFAGGDLKIPSDKIDRLGGALADEVGYQIFLHCSKRNKEKCLTAQFIWTGDEQTFRYRNSEQHIDLENIDKSTRRLRRKFGWVNNRNKYIKEAFPLAELDWVYYRAACAFGEPLCFLAKAPGYIVSTAALLPLAYLVERKVHAKKISKEFPAIIKYLLNGNIEQVETYEYFRELENVSGERYN